MANKLVETPWFQKSANSRWAGESTPVWVHIPIATGPMTNGDVYFFPICYIEDGETVLDFLLDVTDAAANALGTIGWVDAEDYEGAGDTDASSVIGGTNYDIDAIVKGNLAFGSTNQIAKVVNTHFGDSMLAKNTSGRKLLFLSINTQDASSDAVADLWLLIAPPYTNEP